MFKSLLFHKQQQKHQTKEKRNGKKTQLNQKQGPIPKPTNPSYIPHFPLHFFLDLDFHLNIFALKNAIKILILTLRKPHKLDKTP